MGATFRAILFLSSVVAALSVSNACANGRTSPRSSDVSVVNATCAKRSGNSNQDILRARVLSGQGPQKTISLLVGSGTEQLAIADIHTLVLPSTRVDSRGFVDAKIRRNDGDAETRVKVQIRSGKAPLRLAGFDSNGGDVSIAFSECKRIEFFSNPKGADNLHEEPEAKK